jgi:hypothetical protein
MRKVRCCVVLAVVALVSPAVLASTPGAKEAKPLPVALGMSAADVEAKLGKPKETASTPDGTVVWKYREKETWVEVSFERSRVARIVQAVEPKKSTAAEATGQKLVKVSGKVRFKDGTTIPVQEKEKGPPPTINYRPVGEATPGQIRKGAGAAIQADGTFELMTFKPGDGVFPGKYTVTIQVYSKEPKPGASLVPLKYSNPRTSDLEFQIEKPTGDIVIELDKP